MASVQAGMSAFRRLKDVLLPNGGSVVILHEGYFDESGSLDEEPGVFCVSGYLIDAERAVEMDRIWGEVISHPDHHVPFFHMVDCAHGTESFKLLDETSRIVLAKKLIHLIKEFTYCGFTIFAIRRAFYEGRAGADVYSYCVGSCIDALDTFLHVNKMDRASTAYFFEAGHKNKGNSYNHVAEKIKEWGASLTFASKTGVKLLQAADLLAWQSTKYLKDRMSGERPPRKDFLSLMEHKHTFIYVDMDEKGTQMAFEEWPIHRRPSATQSLRVEGDGPVEFPYEDDIGIPIIPVDRPTGWRHGFGGLAHVYFESIGEKAFGLAIGENRVYEIIGALISATQSFNDGESRVSLRMDDVNVTDSSDGVVLEMNFVGGGKIKFSIGKDAKDKLRDMFNKS